MKKRIKDTETRQFKMILHNTVNDHNTLFGGLALQWMDEVAYITATRFTRMKMVTVPMQNVKFLKPAKCGFIAEVVGKVLKIEGIKLEIIVEIFLEEIKSDKRSKAVEAFFTFAAVNNDHHPIRLP